jgi:hypothetical protein
MKPEQWMKAFEMLCFRQGLEKNVGELERNNIHKKLPNAGYTGRTKLITQNVLNY